MSGASGPRVHHLALRTLHLSALERFYVDVVGLRVIARTAPRSVWLAAGETVLMLELASPEEPAIAPRSLELIAFAVSEREKAALERALAERGIAIEARTDFTVYFRDPDGRRVGASTFAFELA